MSDPKTTVEPGSEAHFREAMAEAIRQPGPTPREQFVADGSLSDQPWDDWKRDMLACATKDGMAGIDPDSYRDFYDDGHTPSDALDEDQSCG